MVHEHNRVKEAAPGLYQSLKSEASLNQVYVALAKKRFNNIKKLTLSNHFTTFDKSKEILCFKTPDCVR